MPVMHQSTTCPSSQSHAGQGAGSAERIQRQGSEDIVDGRQGRGVAESSGAILKAFIETGWHLLGVCPASMRDDEHSIDLGMESMISSNQIANLSRFQFFASVFVSTANAADPLPSWNEDSAKKSILDFVAAVTDEGGKDYVNPAERVAVFDNDGTLWVEQPNYPQITFALDRVKALASQRPEWKTRQPFKALLEGDMKTVAASGKKGILEMVIATHTGMTAEEFSDRVTQWVGTAKHPKFNRLYTELVYQPQLELMAYLRDNGFKVFIVSGGGIEFMRPWTEQVYGVPPEQVIGSSVKTEFQIKDGKPVLVRIPEVNFFDDKAGKPVGIHQHIGRRPILAFGNSDNDMQMIQYTMAGEGRRLGLFLHHTDAEREYAYDRKIHFGTLDKVLDLADANGWIIVDMKKDWKKVFPEK
jgi:phosphoserine phosphatase